MLPQAEYERFIKWFRDSYKGYSTPLNNEGILQNSAYQGWVAIGRPTQEGRRGTDFEKTRPPVTTGAAEEGVAAETGFTTDVYLRIMEENFRLQAKEAHPDWDEKKINKELAPTLDYYRNLVKYQSDVGSLPQWADVRQTWVLSVGEAVTPDIIKVGGSYYNQAGIPIPPNTAFYGIEDYLGTGKMPEGERARLEEDKRQANLAMQKWATQFGAEQQRGAEEQEATRLWRKEQADLQRAELAQRGKQDTMEQIRADLENQYEMDRLKELAGLGANPADWIKRYERMHDPNPYSGAEWRRLTYPMYGLSSAQQALAYSQAAAGNVAGAQGIFNRLPYTVGLPFGVPQSTFQLGNIPETQSQVALNMLYSAKLQEATAQQAQVEAGKLQAYNAATGGYGGLAPNLFAPPPNAPAPFWLSQFVPNQVTGQPITRQRVGTPSPQTWGATPWSVQQGLKGYAEWAGGEPLIDIIGRMESMIPIGGTAKRWLPRRQKTFV